MDACVFLQLLAAPNRILQAIVLLRATCSVSIWVDVPHFVGNCSVCDDLLGLRPAERLPRPDAR